MCLPCPFYKPKNDPAGWWKPPQHLVSEPRRLSFPLNTPPPPPSPRPALREDDDNADDSSKWRSWWAGWQPVLRAAEAMKQMTRMMTMKTTAGVTCSCTLGEWRPAPSVDVGLVRSAQMLWWLRGLFGCISVHCLSLMRRATCVLDSSITSKGKQLRGKHAAHILIGRVILVVGWNAVLHCCCLLLGRVKNLQVESVQQEARTNTRG